VETYDFMQGLYQRADELKSERAEHESPDDDDGIGGRQVPTLMIFTECSMG